MKQVFAVGFLVLAVSACTPQSPPHSTAFDGYYEKPVVTKESGMPRLGPLPYVPRKAVTPYSTHRHFSSRVR